MRKRRRPGTDAGRPSPGDDRDPQLLDGTLSRLVADHGWALDLRVRGVFARWPEIVAAAGEQLEPHLIAAYLLELAQGFQTYYNDHQFLVDAAAVRDARLALALAVRQVLANGLGLLGVQAPERM